MFKSLIVALAISSPAFAAEKTVLKTENIPYASLNDAAIAGLNTLKNEKFEHVGFIIQATTGEYFVTTTATDGAYKIQLSNLGISTPIGAKMVGMFHNHPIIDLVSNIFSDDDINVCDAMKISCFMYSKFNGKMYIYEPGNSKKIYFRDNSMKSDQHLKTAEIREIE